MTILVTGGAGYIGSHVCKALARAGETPVVYDNLSKGHEWAVRWGPLERGDLLDAERLRGVFARHRPEAVIHFAALIEVGESVREPEKYYRNNVGGSLTLLEEMRRAGCARIVFSSTAAVYGNPAAGRITEDHPKEPISPYGRSKRTVELMIEDASAARGLGHAFLRYFNAAGADADGELGEAHDPESHLIPIVLGAAAGERPRIGVFGDRYPTRDGTCVRDYVHVEDLADAHLRALAHLEAGKGPLAANLGTGRGHTVREVIEAARRVTGAPIPEEVLPERPGDPAVLVADPSLARERLGWAASRGLEEMIASAWAWRRGKGATCGT